jgi:hypothetical protein
MCDLGVKICVKLVRFGEPNKIFTLEKPTSLMQNWYLCTERRHNTQHYDFQYNDILNNDTQRNDIHPNDTKHK